MRLVAFATFVRRWCVLVILLCAVDVLAGESASSEHAAVITNLFQLRAWADQRPSVVRPFRIVADVFDVDSAAGLLVLRDLSGLEFIKLDIKGKKIEPGATVCLEGNGCAFQRKNFGLLAVPGLVVDNDGLHGLTVESGCALLHAGLNPISVQWFNGIGDFSLEVEYEGPGLPRQQIPNSSIFRAKRDSATGKTNYSGGLDYRCYEGAWEFLPDFAKLQPVKTGVATNFDLAVRTRNEAVGLEFKGFIEIPRDGVYTFYDSSDDGSRLFVGESSVEVRVLVQNPAPPATEKVPMTAVERNSSPWLTLEGTVDFSGIWKSGWEFQMRVGNDEIRVDVFDGGDLAPSFPPGARVRVTGVYQDVVTEDGSRVPGVLLVSSCKAVSLAPARETRFVKQRAAIETTNPPGTGTALTATTISPITTVTEIKALSPKLIEQQLPVSIRGVVVSVLPSGQDGVIQDSTAGIFVSLPEHNKSETFHLGEFCQVDGVTGPGLFAPLIIARRIRHLGTGQLPQPQHATWDQLMSGNLDAQYAEIEGVVTAIHDQRMEMLTEGGKLTLDISELRIEILALYENAHIRIRGCIFGPFNGQTHKLEPGLVSVGNPTIQVLQSAPRDLFDAPQKHLGELLLYDPKAAPFRLLKVSGQVIYGQAGLYYLTDGTNGIRVATRDSNLFAVGELVDAVGFLKLVGPSLELKEAVMRKTGQAPLPTPIKLTPDHLLLASHADTLVQVNATLMNQWREGSENILELQSGFLAFRARIKSDGQPVKLPPSGSRLELTGVYVPQGNGSGDGTVNGFNLLLPTPADVRVLTTPSIWTLKRVLTLTGMLAAILCVVLAWNKELHRQVRERGHQLEMEMRNRQQAEFQHAAEAERSRIARDLHDELGTGLTEVSLLASAGLGALIGEDKKNERFRAIAGKARALVSGLDVIVWAVNPKCNSLQSFADYVAGYVAELLSVSDIVSRFRIPIECGSVTISGASRHALFLAVKEALNNVIRHASATEVELQMAKADNRLKIIITDNGRGFDWSVIRRGNGITNLYERLAALHGECRIESQPGKGTTIQLIVPLPENSELVDRKNPDIS